MSTTIIGDDITLSESASIITGSGNDNIHASSSMYARTSSKLQTGSGNDSISLKKLLLSTLTTGAGDDSVNIKNILESVIDGVKIKRQDNS